MPCEGARHPEIDVGTWSISTLFIRMMWFRLTLTMLWPSDNVTAVLRLRTVTVVCLAVAAVVTVAIRETPAGVAQ
jgi:hypothetical protein